MKRAHYYLFDRDLLGDAIRRKLICSWRDHDWRPKMYGDLCHRCSLFRYGR